MYAPHQFREERRNVLVAAMRDIQLAAIVTPGADGLCATHAPVVVREQDDALVLEFHVARQNPHWKLVGAKSLMIFQGPQAYIHPGWYESKAEHGRAVPTWPWNSPLLAKGRRWCGFPAGLPVRTWLPAAPPTSDGTNGA